MSNNRSYRKSAIPETAKKVFDGIIFDVYQWEQELYDGSKTTFEMLSRPDTAVVYPVLDDGRILLVEDTQPTGEYLCAPGGRVDKGETNEDAARRELLEETGYAVERLTLLYEYVPNSKIDQTVYVYVGHGAKKVQDPDPGAGEKIVLHPVTFGELVELASKKGFETELLTFDALQAKLDPAKMAQLKAAFGV